MQENITFYTSRDNMIYKDRNTIFGQEWEVAVYTENGQTKSHISILAHPEDVEKIKEILKNESRRRNDNI